MAKFFNFEKIARNLWSMFRIIGMYNTRTRNKTFDNNIYVQNVQSIFGKICRKFWDKLVKILEKFYEKFDKIFEKYAENAD